VPLDFVSYHCYGLGNTDGAAEDVDGHQRLFLSRNLDQISDRAHKQDAIIQKSAMPTLPVHVTEWSASYSNHDPIHDSYFEAPYVLEQLKKTRTLGSMSYWTFSDIFEESGPPKTPFEGGFGLINLQGIKKPAFFAYQFLNQLGDQELKNTDARSWVCRDQTGGVQALIYDLTDPRPDMTATDWDFFHKRIIPAVKPPIHLQIASLPPGKYRLAIYRTGFEENDAFSEYLKMGTPSQLTRPQVQHLKDLASGSPAEQSEVTVDGGGKWQRDFAMRDNEVVFATLTPETGASGMHR
jgi:xylan 1,4-beta-xylosidase